MGEHNCIHKISTCVYLQTQMYIYISIYKNVHVFTQTSVHINTYIYIQVCVYKVCMIIHTNSLYTCKYIYFYTHRYIYTVNNTGQTLSAFKTYICIHTHTCRYLQMLSLSPNCQQKQNQISEFIFLFTTDKSAVTML